MENNDDVTLARDEPLSESIIQAILAQETFDRSTLITNPSSYGRYYMEAGFEAGRAIPIGNGVETILCPIHVGENGLNHWIGVVVRIRDGDSPQERHINMQLLDPSPVQLYAEDDIFDMIVNWLSHSLRRYQLVFPRAMSRTPVPHQEGLNACGIHAIENLIAAGQGRGIDED